MKTPSLRNSPCPCGSGRRFKHCHGSVDRQQPLQETTTPLDAAREMLAEGKFVEVIGICEASLGSVVDTDFETLRVIGQAAALLGDAEKTMSTWQTVLAEFPDDPEALFYLVNQSHMSGDLPAAIRYFEHALKQDPNNFILRNNLGIVLEAAGRLNDAEKEFRQANQVTGNSFESQTNLAQNLFRQKKLSEALQWFDRVVSQNEVSDPAIWANRAVCQHKMGDLPGASSSFKRALEFETNSVELYLEFGLVNREMSRFEIASQAFEQCLSLDPANIKVLSELQFCHQNLALWKDFDANQAKLIEYAKINDEVLKKPISPFPFLSLCDDPALQKSITRSWVLSKTES